MSADHKPHPLNEKSGGLRSPAIRKLAKDGPSWTPTEQVTRDKCLKQFCKAGRKGVEVSSGNSEAFQRGWDAVFGTPEAKARALAEIEAEKAGGDPHAERVCLDFDCTEATATTDAAGPRHGDGRLHLP